VSAPAPVVAARPPIVRKRSAARVALVRGAGVDVETLRRDPLRLADLLAAFRPNIRRAVGDVARWFRCPCDAARGELLRRLEAEGQLYVLQHARDNLAVPLHSWLYVRLRKHLAKEAREFLAPLTVPRDLGLPRMAWLDVERNDRNGRSGYRPGADTFGPDHFGNDHGAEVKGGSFQLTGQPMGARGSAMDVASIGAWQAAEDARDAAERDRVVRARVAALPSDEREYAHAVMAEESDHAFGRRTGRNWRGVEVVRVRTFKRLAADPAMREVAS
jgi:hypothetical protein